MHVCQYVGACGCGCVRIYVDVFCMRVCLCETEKILTSHLANRELKRI